MKFRSSIRPHYIYKVLKKGTLFALGGVGCLCVGGIFFPVSILNGWGLPLWFVGVGAIAWGLIPSRKLKYMELHPFELYVEEGQKVLLVQNQQVKGQFWLKDVAGWEYVENGDIYGIRVLLKSKNKSIWLPYFLPHVMEKLKAS